MVALICLLPACTRIPDPRDLQAALGGFDEADVRGVVQTSSGYMLTGKCRQPSSGFEVRVEFPGGDLESLLGTAKSAIQRTCSDKKLEQLNREIRRLEGRSADGKDEPECARLAARYEAIRKSSLLERDEQNRTALKAEARQIQKAQDEFKCLTR